jgi:hypothetical protein
MTRLGYQIPNFTYPGVDSADTFSLRDCARLKPPNQRASTVSS